MSNSGHFSDGRRSNFTRTCNLLSQFVKEKGSLRDLNFEIGGKVESLDQLVKSGSSLSASIPSSANARLASTEKRAFMDSSMVIVEDDLNEGIAREDAEHGTAAQLTIFYAGRVLVFDDYPADKFRRLLSIAKKDSSRTSYGVLSSNTVEKKTKSHVASGVSREGLPPRPQADNSKQHVGISSNTCRRRHSREEKRFRSSKAIRPSSIADEELPPQSSGGSDLPIARRSSLHRFIEKRKDRTAVRGAHQYEEETGPSSTDTDREFDLNIMPQLT